MTEMAEFVYKIYMQKIEALKESIETVQKMYEELPVEKEAEEAMEVDGESTSQETEESSKKGESTKKFVETPIKNLIDEQDLPEEEKE